MVSLLCFDSLPLIIYRLFFTFVRILGFQVCSSTRALQRSETTFDAAIHQLFDVDVSLSHFSSQVSGPISIQLASAFLLFFIRAVSLGTLAAAAHEGGGGGPSSPSAAGGAGGGGPGAGAAATGAAADLDKSGMHLAAVVPVLQPFLICLLVLVFLGVISKDTEHMKFMAQRFIFARRTEKNPYAKDVTEYLRYGTFSCLCVCFLLACFVCLCVLRVCFTGCNYSRSTLAITVDTPTGDFSFRLSGAQVTLSLAVSFFVLAVSSIFTLLRLNGLHFL